MDEDRVGLDSNRLEQGSKKRVLVLAVPVSVLEDVVSGMRLKAADTKGDAHVAKIQRHIAINRLDLLGIRLGVLRKLGRLGAQVRSGHGTLLFKGKSFGTPEEWIKPYGNPGRT